MSVTREALDQAWRLRSTLVLVLAPTLFLFLGVVLVTAATGRDPAVVTRDPLAFVEAHPLTGFLSTLGVMMWSASIGACAVGALGLARSDSDRGGRLFFAWSAALCLLLALDDAFQIHEDVVPRILGRGQTFVLAAYVIVTLLWVWRFRAYLRASEFILVGVAGALFALSMGIDLFLGLTHVFGEEDAFGAVVGGIVEDGAKFAGIALWLTYFIRTAATALVRARGTPGP